MLNIDLSGLEIKSMRGAFGKDHLARTSVECWGLVIVAGLATWLLGGNFAYDLLAVTAMWFILNWTMDTAEEPHFEEDEPATIRVYPPAPETVVDEPRQRA